jgi:hypothetical protein
MVTHHVTANIFGEVFHSFSGKEYLLDSPLLPTHLHLL